MLDFEQVLEYLVAMQSEILIMSHMLEYYVLVKLPFWLFTGANIICKTCIRCPTADYSSVL